jgi:4'-phosphopantetheinyl transferase EntD
MSGIVERLRGALRDRGARRRERRQEQVARRAAADAELRRTGASGAPPVSHQGTVQGGGGSMGGF